MTVIHLHQDAIERASEADRVWFDAHVGRCYRLRDSVPYEFNAPLGPALLGMSWRVIVASVPDLGIRFRVSVIVSDNIADLSDDVLGQMFADMAQPEVVDFYRKATNG